MRADSGGAFSEEYATKLAARHHASIQLFYDDVEPGLAQFLHDIVVESPST